MCPQKMGLNLAFIVVVALAYASRGATARTWIPLLSQDTHLTAPPDFCRGIECPPFTSKQTKSGYEIRTYEAGKWVVCDVHAARVEIAIATGFARIGLYLQGRNADKQRITQTVPVSAYYNKKGDFEEGRNYSIALYIPKDVQKDVPTPTDEGLRIEDVPKTTWYVASFPGYATEGLVLKRAEMLSDALTKDGASFKDGEWVFNVYDPPTKFTGRHNEVGFIMKGSDSVAQLA